MPSSSPSPFRRSSFSSLDAVARTRAPARLAILDCRDPHPARARVDQDGLPAHQMAELEEAVVRGTEGNGHARRRLRRETRWNLPGELLIHGTQCGVRAVDTDGHHPITHFELRDPAPDLRHGAGALVANDVGRSVEFAPPPIEGVTSFDADRLDLNQHVRSADRRVGNVLVAKDAGLSRLVVDRGLHSSPFAFAQTLSIACGRGCRVPSGGTSERPASLADASFEPLSPPTIPSHVRRERDSKRTFDTARARAFG